MSMSARKSWWKKKGESAKAFAAFAIYRELGYGRTMEQVRIKLGHRQARTVEAWSAKFGWVQRVMDWEENEDRIRIEARRKAAVAMEERHAMLTGAITAKLAKWIAKFDDAKIAALKPGDAARLVDVAIKHERLARGLSTERRESNVKADVEVKQRERPLEELTDDELLSMIEGEGTLP